MRAKEASKTVAYGCWPSPITASRVVESAVRLDGVCVGSRGVYWSELRPAEGGRVAIVRWRATDGARDVLPEGYSARTRVHEYGGGALWVHGDTLYFANWEDQRLYRLREGAERPEPLTPQPPREHALRYADGSATPGGDWVICVRESHGDGEPRNELVAVSTSGEEVRVVVSGPDFVAAPRVSPDGRWLCWICWKHPDMPWDSSELWVGRLEQTSGSLQVAGARRVAGGAEESIVQPAWSPDGRLHFVSDRSDFWNLYRFDDPPAESAPRNLAPVDGEIGTPPWVFGQSRYAFVAGSRISCAYARGGVDHLGLIDPASETLETVSDAYTALGSLAAAGGELLAIAASARAEPAIVRLHPQSGALQETLRPPRELGLGPEYFSEPRAIDFSSSGGRTAHALFYPPTNPNVAADATARPPLIVSIHGGPTAAARPTLNLATQFWTSRGFAVVDVNYGGSTGYGRRYRNQLRGAWGQVDVDDCLAAARVLAERGMVDGQRMAIHGGSAGGFTVLAALAFHDVFSAGASYYGVADLEALAQDTHKFESRYLDRLVGPYPERRDLYVQRSPIHHVDGFDKPLLVLQGLQDRIVPPNQSEMIVQALRDKGVPVAYVAFEGEQHGFRQADNIRRALEAELGFYARIWRLDLPERLPELPIDNL